MNREDFTKALNYVLGEEVVKALFVAQVGIVTILNQAVLHYFTHDMQEPTVERTLRRAMRQLEQDGALTFRQAA